MRVRVVGEAERMDQLLARSRVSSLAVRMYVSIDCIEG